jgi:hypothetical protein
MDGEPGEGTYRVAEQTGRYSRFAKVTVQVAACREGVEIADGAVANEEWRHAARLGAEYATRRLPHGWAKPHVTVVSVVGTEVDTVPATVYEATARAVWQALDVPQEHRHAVINDRTLVHSILATLRGRQLEKVIEARYWHEGQRDGDPESLIHVWLYFASCPPLMLSSLGEHVGLANVRPYPSYSMDEYGETSVGPAAPPDLLSSFVGANLDGASALHWDVSPDECSAMVFRFDTGQLVIGSLADEWVISQQVPGYAETYWTTIS